ncbi:MAG: hypothetical protein U0452_07490 [Anaerolineae bacterium]
MKRSRLLLPGLLLLLVMLAAACSPPPELRDQKLLNDDSLITGEPCEAPCWRGITPGVTAWSEALTILEDDRTIEDPTTQTADDSSAVAASFKEPGGIDASGQIFSDNGNTVGLIFLRLAPDMTLDEVLAKYGDPTWVIGTPFSDDPPQAIVNLVYPDEQMIVYVFVPGKEGALDGTNEIVGVLYMQASDMETLLKTSSLHAWEGLADFATYGPDSPFEVTPEPTAEGTQEATPEATAAQ